MSDGSPELIANVYARSHELLNGSWRRIVDPLEAGYYDIFGRASRNGFFQNERDPSGGQLIEYDFERSPQLRVPGDWNTQERELLYYEGTVWYGRHFPAAPLGASRRYFLYFGAANYQARVFLNGRELGVHEGGFTPFQFEVTEALVAGDNFVAVKVDNRRRKDAVPGEQSDWWNYGGLTRDVLFVDVPETYVRDYAIALEGGQLRGWVQLDGSRGQQAVQVRIPEAELECSVQTDAAGRATFAFDAVTLDRWSPEDPRLYDVEIRAESDATSERIGFRTIERRGEDIVLNGEPVFLRGISIHEEAPTREGRAWSEEDARTLLGWARELGCNFVRLAHYPHNEHMVRVADELGLLVWAEIPVYWHIDWTNAATLECARSQLLEIMTRDRNRASVILWSVANETPGSPERLAFLRSLIDTVRQVDPSRLVAAALLGIEGLRELGEFVSLRAKGEAAAPPVVEMNDELGEHIDVIGRNDYAAWYMPRFVAARVGVPEREARKFVLESQSTVEWKSRFGKPMILSEFGAGALQGRRGDALDVFTEDCQATIYRAQIDALETIPFLRGFSPWILRDFRSPRRVLPDVQDGYNRKGLVSDRGVRKQAFSVLQAFYRSKRKETS